MIQEQVLNLVLQNKDPSIITLNNLTEDYFSEHTAEFQYIKAHYEKYGAVPDMATFLNVFTEFPVLDVSEPVSYLLEELTRDKNRRFLISNFNKIRDLILKDDVDHALSILQDAAENSGNMVSLNAVNLVEDTSRYQAYEDKINNIGSYYIKTGFPELDAVTGGWDINEDLVAIVARLGLGKCLEKGTKVLMADGSIKNVEDVVIGDSVQSLNRVNTVVGCHSGTSKGYKIIPTLGDPFVVSENHILTLMKRNQINNKNGIFHTTDNTFTMVDMMIEDYLQLTPNQRYQYELYRPSIDYSAKELPIPPYILGLWLGDGTTCRPELTTQDPEILEAWTKYAEVNGCKARQNDAYGLSTTCSYEITAGRKGAQNPVLNTFRGLNLLNNKHIPLEYMTGSREQRLELLAGILDTDGYMDKKYRKQSDTTNCTYSLCLKLRPLVEQVAQLARGLNFRVGKISERKLEIHPGQFNYYYTISIHGKVADIPCRLARKQAVNSSSNRVLNMCRFKIEEIPQIEYYGFMTDGDHRFLLADNTLTHNTWIALKCATAAVAQGKRVGIYSGEMSEDTVGYRVDTLLGHISNGALMHGGGSVRNQYQAYLEHLREIAPGELYVLTPKMINGQAGVSALRAFIEKYNLDILFVDQHSLLEDDRKGKTPVEKASNISKDLKLLQTTKRIPIICVAQQNREKLEDKTFDAAQIASADRIGQDASQIIFIERKDDLVRLHLVKSRNSGAGNVFTYRTDLNIGSFQFIPEGNEMANSAAEAGLATTAGYSEDEVVF